MHQLLTSDKLLSATDAIARFVRPGAVVGLGGQNINRCPMALVHELIRAGTGDLTVVGCNLSLPLDMLAANGQVVRTEQGSGNLEKYGALFEWRRRAERGDLEVKDYSHLAMASRFLAGSLGLPFMPTRSLIGSDVLKDHLESGDARLYADPWSGAPVVLLKALTPDVSLIHASRADADGNVVIDGVTSHEVDMVKASAATVVSVEEVLPAGALAGEPERVTISSAFVSAVVHQPYGAFPTSVYKLYDYHEPEIVDYQRRSRYDDGLDTYLDACVRDVRTFDDYLERQDPGGATRRSLEDAMRSLMGILR
ncbi:MAG TPA: CoA-transferase [Kribbellaceae bacterium]